jgi:FkbM family methyltransferase
MKVEKLTSAAQPHNQLDLVRQECHSYPLDKVHIDEDEIVLDIGANVGGCYHAWKHRFPNWYLVEPSTYNCEQIVANGYTGKYSRNAVGAKSGEVVKLQSYKADGSDTPSSNFGTTGFVNEGNGHGWQGDYEEVVTLSFKDVTAGKKIGLLKVDCEGAEYDFLMGVNLSNIKYIVMELHNFLGKKKQDNLMKSIEKTHREIYSIGDGVESHFVKLWERR